MASSFSLLHLLVAIGLLGTGATLIVPWAIAEDILANEDQAVLTLQKIAEEQERFRRLHGDGRFASLGELLGVREDQALPEGYRPALRFEAFEDRFGRLKGYEFAVWLVDEAGRPTRMARGLNRAEGQRFFVAYAWPVAHGISGRSLFAMAADGTIWRTENEIQPWTGKSRIPPAELLGARLKSRAFGPPPPFTERVPFEEVR